MPGSVTKPLSAEELSALRYIKDHSQEEVIFYPSMHARCPEGSTWTTHAVLRLLHRKKLVLLAGLKELPVRLWITEAGLAAVDLGSKGA